MKSGRATVLTKTKRSGRNMFTILSLMLILGYIGARGTRADNTEPTCYSRFDYEMRMFETVADMKVNQKALMDTVNKLQDLVEKLGTKVDIQEQGIANLSTNITTQQAALQTLDSSVQQIEDQTAGSTTNKASNVRTAPILAFTVYGPSDGEGNTILFGTVVTNEGGLYATSTGKITCQTAGLYFFSLHVIKKRDTSNRVDLTGCEIHKNGSKLTKAFLDPADAHADLGSYGASTSAYVKLDVGDVIHVHRSSAAETMEPMTTFSGALIVATP